MKLNPEIMTALIESFNELTATQRALIVEFVSTCANRDTSGLTGEALGAVIADPALLARVKSRTKSTKSPEPESRLMWRAL